MIRSRRAAGVAAAAASVALVLAACGPASTPLSSRQRQVQGTDTNVAFKNCFAKCSGTLDGAKYAIVLPKKWNGTLLLYSHGYRFAAAGPPDFTAPDTDAQVSSTDTNGTGSDPLSQKLLAEGYALAGSSFKANGWDVADGVRADNQLYHFFSSTVAAPRRTYVWGDSLGGLITEIVAEKYPSWVDGAAPMCGAVAGPTLNLNLALDVAFAVKTLIDPSLQLTGYTSYQEANDQWRQVEKKLIAAASDTANGGTAKVLFIAALVNAPDKTQTYDGSTIQSQVEGTVESLLTALAYGTAGRYNIEQLVGGDPSSNAGVNYADRITPAEASLVQTVGGNLQAYETALADAPRLSGDPAAKAKFEALGDTTGNISVPTVTMHTEDDPLVLVANESVLAQRAQAHGDSGRLVQLFISPPATYSEKTGAPYGAGHCNFSDGQREALITTLNDWVQQGIYPTAQGLTGRFGPGLDPSYVAPPWPAAVSG